MDKLLLCDISAFQCWDNGYLKHSKPVEDFWFDSCATYADELSEFALPRHLSRPVHFITTNPNHRLSSRKWRGHMQMRDLPSQAVRYLDRGVYVTSPELAYLQMARHLSLVGAARLGMELCGGYSTLWSIPYYYLTHPESRVYSLDGNVLGSAFSGGRPFEARTDASRDAAADPLWEGSGLSEPEWNAIEKMKRDKVLSQLHLQPRHVQMLEAHGFVQRAPVTTVENLRQFANAVYGDTSRAVAVRALRWVANNSNSPRETYSFLRFCLPRVYGGYGLPPYRMNVAVPLTPRLSRLARGEKYVCDGVWESPPIAFEYYGEKYHSGVANVSRDNLREMILEELGFEVIPVAQDEMGDIAVMDYIAERVAKALQVRLGPMGPHMRERQKALCRELNWRIDLYRPGVKLHT